MRIKDTLTPRTRERTLKLGAPTHENQIQQTQEIPPFPEDNLCWPYDEFLDIISPTTEMTREGTFLGITTGLGMAIGRKVALPLTNPLYPVIWGLVIAPPYFQRKGSPLTWSDKIATKLTPNLQKLRGLGSVERVNDILSPKEGTKLFIRIAELGSTLAKAMRSGTMNIPYELCELHDHEEGWETATRQTKPCYGYTVSLMAATTLRGIEPLLKEIHITGGLLRRFLIVHPSVGTGVSTPPQPNQQHLQRLFEKIEKRLAPYGDKTLDVTLDPEAQDFYQQWYLPWRKDCMTYPEGQMEILGGTESTARKLALQRAAIENTERITLVQIQWAITWAIYFQAHALHLVASLTITGWRRTEEQILRLLTKRPMRGWEIQKSLTISTPSTTLARILDGMRNIGRIQLNKEKTPKGRQADYWKLSETD